MISLFTNFYLASITVKDFYTNLIEDKEIIEYLASISDFRAYTFWEFGISQALPIELMIQIRVKSVLYSNKTIEGFLSSKSIQTLDYFWEEHLSKTQGTIFKLNENTPGEVEVLPPYDNPTELIISPEVKIPVYDALTQNIQKLSKIIMENLVNNLVNEVVKSVNHIKQPGTGYFGSRHLEAVDRQVVIISTLIRNYPEIALYFYNIPITRKLDLHLKFPSYFPEWTGGTFLQFILRVLIYIIPQRAFNFFTIPEHLKKKKTDLYFEVNSRPVHIADYLAGLYLDETIPILNELISEENKSPAFYVEEMRELIPQHFFYLPKFYTQNIGVGKIDALYKILCYYFAKQLHNKNQIYFAFVQVLRSHVDSALLKEIPDVPTNKFDEARSILLLKKIINSSEIFFFQDNIEVKLTTSPDSKTITIPESYTILSETKIKEFSKAILSSEVATQPNLTGSVAFGNQEKSWRKNKAELSVDFY